MLQLKYKFKDEVEEREFLFEELSQYNIAPNITNQDFTDLNITSSDLSPEEKVRYYHFFNEISGREIETVKLYNDNILLFDNEIFFLKPKRFHFNDNGEYNHLPDGTVTQEFTNSFIFVITFVLK